MGWILDWLLGQLPWWTWAVVAVVILLLVLKWFGWQGLIAAGLAVAAFFGYRQGWKDNQEGKTPIVPVDPIQVRPPENKPRVKKKMKTLVEWLNDQRH